MGDFMKIWRVDKNVDDYSGFYLKNEDDKNILEEKLDKGDLVSNWNELEVEVHEADKPIGDCPHLWSGGYSLIVSERGKEIISNNYKNYIQFLSLNYSQENQKFYVLNNLNIIDCVDYNKSELEILMNKYIVDVKKYVFNENAKKAPIFKIYLDGVIKISTFVNNDFKNLIEDSRLEGFKFTEVFDFEA